jgi:hypothetical protein
VRRVATAVLLVALVAVALPACGKPERDALIELRAAMARTEKLPRRIQYEEVTNDGTDTAVRAIIEDDFRYKARLDLNGQPAMDEVIHDDALADRIVEPGAMKLYLKSTPGTTATGTGTSGGATSDPAATEEALRTKHWVLDKSGAPPIFSNTTERRLIGQDPILDARNVFQYIDEAIRSMPLRKFNPNNLDYKPKEDPFPKPAKSSGVKRYDFLRFPVPRPSENTGGNQSVPQAANFRKMSVYVKDGLVIRVLEDIDVASRLRDIERNYSIKLTGTTPERIDSAVAAINVVIKGQGSNTPLRVRKMSLELTELGKAQHVELPTTDVIDGNLAVLAGRGKTKSTAATITPGQGTSGSDTGSADSTTTTAQ